MAEARRLSLAAQGFGAKRPRRVTKAHLLAAIDRMSVLQMDSVNVLERAHYLPLFARLGPYDKTLLDSLAYEDRALFEHWAHMATLIPVQHYGLMRHRMEGHQLWPALRPLVQDGYVERVLEEVRTNGPLVVSKLEDSGPRASRGWWDWNKGKAAIEYHFLRGNIAISSRRNFARSYDIPERVLPPEVLAQRAVPPEEAHRQMLLLGAKSHGVGTAGDLADYFRLKAGEARPRLRELVEAGEVEEVRVEGWSEAAYMLPGTVVPRSMNARALVGPFDPVVWERARAERLFNFRYRIEIYTPQPKRVFGYYVLPFVLGSEIVGRVDLKADRKEKTLQVFASWIEEGQNEVLVARALHHELSLMAEWLKLERVEVHPWGNLADALAKAQGAGGEE